MTLSKRSLALPADPPSVRLARAWVSEVLGEIGRDDLVLTAQLGVSELVTNAIMHAQPPVTVSVSGTAGNPRIEVTDHSPGPLQPLNLATVDENFPTTFGRGLALVAMTAVQWGSETDSDGFGKRVWFEPAQEMHEDTDLSTIFHTAEHETFEERAEPADGAVRVVLLNVPAQLFAHLRRYHFELRRELRLLSLSDPRRYPIAVEVTDIFKQTDLERRETTGVSRLDEAIARGQQSVDLDYAVPPSAPATMTRAYALLQTCYQTFADEHLLSITPPGPLRRLQAWYFGEFGRQGDGEDPVPWTGELDYQDSAASASGA